MPSNKYVPKCRLSSHSAAPRFAIALFLGVGFPAFACGADGSTTLQLPLWSASPFLLLLGCVAILPLVREHWWHANRNKAIVSIGLALPVALYLLAVDADTNGESSHHLFHELGEYASFIILLAALYTISGGILLDGDIPARPRTNTLFLAIGAVLANLIGTTGASMVLIRPLLRINQQRRHKSHLPIFFIFVVSNTGGLLTPLGDPPLFLGFLQGVDFFWTLRLWLEWLVVNSVLLAVFWIWDSAAFRNEPNAAPSSKSGRVKLDPLRLSGFAVNGPLLLGVLLAVIFQSKAMGLGLGKSFGLGDVTLRKPWGELVMIGLSVLSLWLTPPSLRKSNRFVWAPMIEVAVLFIGIFVTMVPALAILGRHGDRLNLTEPWHYFWLTGLLSAFLDNAPTYLTLGTLAAGGHDLGWLSLNRPAILAAISCGAVFMGALTYIGNGPNFMVKAIAEEQGYPMPSFVGFMRYSFGILIPLFAACGLAFIR